MEAARERSGSERLLLAVLLLLAAVAVLEPKGSGLAEPDETRYAEIPREMLASGDFVVPRLNGLPYFEKPPLLYWVNAAALRAFGPTPWAARLPSRLAGLGTAILVVLAAGGFRRREGLAAGILLLAAPLGFLMARTNLTDGLLTFFFTATLLAARAAIERRAGGRPWMNLAAWAGAAAAGAFLTKGLIAFALPGLILLVWCTATGRLRGLLALAASPALPVFAALAAPWFVLVERRHPGFLEFFFIHEHLQRFATAEARRTGPIWYFIPVIAVGFLPGLTFLVAALRRAGRRADEGFFFGLWFAAVFVFFSLSQSKLPPYVFPALPAAAILAGRAAGAATGRRLWIVHAILATALAAALILDPVTRGFLVASRLQGIVAPALAFLVVASWFAVLFAGNAPPLALASLGAGWAALLLSAVIGWPRTLQARFIGELAAAAKREGAPRVPLVGYREYLKGMSLELGTVTPVVEYIGELEPGFETDDDKRAEIVWSSERFWDLWKSDRPVLALVRLSDLVEMMKAAPPARVVRYAGRHAVVANFAEPGRR